MKVVLVTEAKPRVPAETSIELEPLLEAFAKRGIEARTGAWDDPSFDWAAVELAILRTPWNYHRHLDAFLAWTKRVPRLLNPPDVVAWNARKTYLRELEQRGLAVVPTKWIDRDQSLDVWDEAVLKPVVSAGSFRTRRFKRGAEPRELLREILTEGPAMLQPYFASVETTGERSLVFFGGELSHAVKRKPPLETGLHGGEVVPAEPDERALASAVLATQPPMLYARVDLARDAHGKPHLMELELIEPSFFLDVEPSAADRFVDAVLVTALRT